MEFEYDSAKSESNKAKHGIDFVEAQVLWSDTYRIEIQAQSTTEPRTIVIGKIGEKHWSAIVTYRGAAIRIISVRRARENEVKVYES